MRNDRYSEFAKGCNRYIKNIKNSKTLKNNLDLFKWYNNKLFAMRNNIKEILQKGENEFVEFKKDFNNSTITSLNAFANTKGGKGYNWC